MKKLKKWLVIELVKMNELLNGSLKFKELNIEKLRETRDTLESQNKALQKDLEVQKALVKTFELSVLSNSDYNEKLREENKALQKEKEEANKMIKTQEECKSILTKKIVILQEQLGLADFTINKLKTKLDCFESLKSEMGSFSKSYTVWIARDRNGETWVFNKKPILHNETTWVSDTFYKKKKTSKDERISFLAKIEDFIDLQPLECKKFKLLEINKP